MTISNTIAKAGPFLGNGITVSYPFSFKLFTKADLKVVKTSTAGVDSTLVLDSDYSVVLNADQNVNPGGTLTTLGTPLAGGGTPEKLTLISNVPDLQQAQLANGGGFFPSVINDMVDTRTIISHQNTEKLDRAVKQPVSDSTTIGDLPNAAARANMFAAYDASGNPIVSGGTASVPVSTFMAGVVSAATTAAALAALGVGAFTTGDSKFTYKTVADAGWIMMNDGTIGNAASGATTRANADTAALYALFWNNTANADCAVSTGRGASAAADFAANKTLALPKVLGRAAGVAGAGSGLTSRALASVVGEEAHTLSTAELAAHTHTVNDAGHTHNINYTNSGSGVGNASIQGASAAANGTFAPGDISAASGITNQNAGSGTAHNNMQPTGFRNEMVKL